MRQVNFVVASIFTVIFGYILILSVFQKDSAMFLGVLIFSGPVFTNWLTYHELSKKKKKIKNIKK